MKKNQTLVVSNAQRMTSLEIAQVTGKMHKDVMKAIRNMEPAWEKVRGRKFALSSRSCEMPNGGYKMVPCYELSKTECLYVATKFNDEARARLVLRWEELERQYRAEHGADMLALTSLNGNKILSLAEEIVGDTLRTNNQHADGCITMTDIARALGMETKQLNAFLCEKGVQRWRKGQYRLTPDYEGRGLAQDRLFIYYSKDGRQKERTYLVWTRLGAEMINEMIGFTK